MGSNMMDEIDCANFFDQIDDLIEFPPADECENFNNVGGNLINSSDRNDFPNMWNDIELPNSDTFISKNAASDLSAELYVPYEDIVQLEWLSTFVEDSYSDAGLNMGKDKSCPVKKDNSQFQTSSPISVLESSSSSSSNSTSSSSIVTKPDNLPLCGPQRARTKRPRLTTFNPRPPTIFAESENFAESHLPPPVKVPELSELDQENKKKKKKKKKKKQKKENDNNAGLSIENDDQVVSAQAIRKCMHCEITKTPQWRAGPMGPKTLCNACGVRYKSGRLFPEYRPAASPTFIPSVHSNSHKKVVEMRNKAGQGNIMSSNPVVVNNKSEEVV